MDIGNPAYQQACVAGMISLARRYGFDGVFIDDLAASWEWDLPVGATVPEYPTTASWQAAVSSFISYAGQTPACGRFDVGRQPVRHVARPRALAAVEHAAGRRRGGGVDRRR